MKVHHLDCCTMCPGTERWIDGQGSTRKRGRLVSHCLLVESDAGLVLVETGIGREDIARPEERMGRFFLRTSRPRLDPSQTAHAQIERLGFSARDVRHIVLTHAHVDHAGGIGDFPHAQVHLYAAELQAVTSPRWFYDRHAYRRVQFAHGPLWNPHQISGDRYLGFEAVRPIAGVRGIAIVPLPGHTRGHAAVAVESSHGTLLHCGDAYFHRNELLPNGRAPAMLGAFSRLVGWSSSVRDRNMERLRTLKQSQPADLHIFCAHDASELEALRSRSLASSVSTSQPVSVT